MDFKTEILKSIQTIIDQKLDNYKADRTFQSVIKHTTKKGYIILDETGSERTVPCCIPGVSLKIGDSVLVKIPNGNLKQIHIVGINGKTKAAVTATQIGSSTIGNNKKPIYLNNGIATACDSSMITYSENEPLELSTGATWIDA